MLKKIVFTISFILISFYGASQKDINNYKYILIPKKFDFLKTEDQYKLNSLTKFLFNKYGYQAYFLDDELPEELKNDRCLALTTFVSKNKGGIFKTKLTIDLKDCFGVVVITSQIGESRLKEYDRAYNEALRNAFVTYQNIEYNYVPLQKTIAEKSKSEAISAKELEVTDKKNVETSAIVAPALVVGSAENKKVVNEGIVEQNIETIYYAQVIENGFQLVNSEPKIIMVLFNTSAKDVFMVKDKNAIVHRDGDLWIYYENNGVDEIKKPLTIKF